MKVSSMNFYIALVCFPVIFVGELPDKTMFASLVMATRGRPLQVWIGAAMAFSLHVAIATTVGVAVFHLLTARAVDALVGVMFVLGAFYAWREAGAAEQAEEKTRALKSRRGAITTSLVVIFLAEWGDLTQILTADLAAKYHSALSVGVGSLLALWVVAALAVAGGQTLIRLIDISTIRKVTAVVLIALAGWSLAAAIG